MRVNERETSSPIRKKGVRMDTEKRPAKRLNFLRKSIYISCGNINEAMNTLSCGFLYEAIRFLGCTTNLLKVEISFDCSQSLICHCVFTFSVRSENCQTHTNTGVQCYKFTTCI